MCLLNGPVSMETNETGIAEFKQLSQKLHGRHRDCWRQAPDHDALSVLGHATDAGVDPEWRMAMHTPTLKNVLTELDDFTKKAVIRPMKRVRRSLFRVL